MLPTMDDVEQYFQTVERFILTSLASASPDLPHIREAVNQLWIDISRFGPPGLPDLRVGVLGPFEVPAPPPLPPPSKSLIEKTGDWIKRHPWITCGVVLSTIGAGLLAGCRAPARCTLKRRIRPTTAAPERRQVVVVLGGDHPLGLPLILELEKKGYIVIASVSSVEAVGAIETKGRGFIRALVLDPNEPGTIPIFLRSLASALSRRFPITAAGDPYVPIPYHPLFHSVISLLTMPMSSAPCVPAPLEHISLRDTYLPYLLSTHIAPLQTLQALLPLLRADAQRTRSQMSIILCLPAADARLGLPFGSVGAMSAFATIRAAEVLRRELSVSQGMGAIRVVTVDVGAIGELDNQSQRTPPSMDDWTPSEKATYGVAFSALSETINTRTPEDVSRFVDSLVGVVSAGTKTNGAGMTIYSMGVGLAYEKVKDWIRGNRFAIGAGAGTYTVASLLPARLVDFLLNLPYILVGIRNALLPIPPPIQLPSVSTNTEGRALGNVPSLANSSTLRGPPNTVDTSTPPPTESQITPDSSETESEAESERSHGDTENTGVASSWVSLRGESPT